MFIFFTTLSSAALVCLKNTYDTSIQHKVQPFCIKILKSSWEAVVGQLSAITAYTKSHSKQFYTGTI